MPGDNDFRFFVDEVYKIPGEGLVLSGEVESGVLRKDMTVFVEMVGEKYNVLRIKGEGDATVVEASAGQRVGVILKGLGNVRIKNGWVLSGVQSEGG